VIEIGVDDRAVTGPATIATAATMANARDAVLVRMCAPPLGHGDAFALYGVARRRFVAKSAAVG
jgi:hypothetical protein